MKTINAKNKSVLIISDIHAPYHHIDLVEFLKAIKKKYKPDIVTCVGDEIDFHQISFHSSDPDLMDAGKELELAQELIGKVEKIFPKIYLCESNHGSLVYRRAKADGIPRELLKGYNDVLGVSKKWSWHESILLKTKLGDTYITHGKTSVTGKLSKEVQSNAVQGHHHGKSQITWHRTPTALRYDMYTGCLINYNSLAFAYGKNHIPKPIISLGYIGKDGYPELIHMKLNSKGRWKGEL